jgi:hypothetical protein
MSEVNVQPSKHQLRSYQPTLVSVSPLAYSINKHANQKYTDKYLH